MIYDIYIIKYIYLTPILHTYTSRPYVYYVVNPLTTTISLKCTPTAKIHIGMLRTSTQHANVYLRSRRIHLRDIVRTMPMCIYAVVVYT